MYTYQLMDQQKVKDTPKELKHLIPSICGLGLELFTVTSLLVM